jgi:hypothetical protein
LPFIWRIKLNDSKGVFAETVDVFFEEVTDQDALAAWLVRAYFNPQKHAGERYYNAAVNKENVLRFVSDSSNGFPQTPYNIYNLWKVLPGLREGLKSVPDDADGNGKEEIYTKGNETLAVIGAAIGGVTPTMVNKISDQATTKFGAMLRALGSQNKWLAIEAEEKIENAFLSVAEVYADGIRAANTPGEVLDYVVTAGLLSLQDALIVDDTELEGLQALIDYAQDGAVQSEIEDLILSDLNKDINVFQSVQLAVSRQVFPPAKRGRPKKDKSEDVVYTDGV